MSAKRTNPAGAAKGEADASAAKPRRRGRPANPPGIARHSTSMRIKPFHYDALQALRRQYKLESVTAALHLAVDIAVMAERLKVPRMDPE